MKNVEKQYNQKSTQGYTKKQDITQHELIMKIMEHEYERTGQIWWFVHELIGFWNLYNQKYFMSYKASSRVAELAKEGLVESRPTEGKLHVYALKSVIALEE